METFHVNVTKANVFAIDDTLAIAMREDQALLEDSHRLTEDIK